MAIEDNNQYVVVQNATLPLVKTLMCRTLTGKNRHAVCSRICYGFLRACSSRDLMLV